MINLDVLKEAAESVASKIGADGIDNAIILGSGWGEVVNAFSVDKQLDYSEVPGFGSTGVAGHAGKLALATLHEKKTMVFQGRRHWYEGEGWTPVAIPVYLAKQFGAKDLFITNAAGGITGSAPGDLVLITDHLNMLYGHPLRGPHIPELGERFPDQTEIYSRRLRELALEAAKKTDIQLKQGVYAAMQGPTYETPAEIEMLKRVGADLVGMSTVPEAILASASGMNVCGISCVSNYAAGLNDQALTHHEVSEVIGEAQPTIRKLLECLWGLL